MNCCFFHNTDFLVFSRYLINFLKIIWKFEISSYLCNPKTEKPAEVAQLVEHNLAKVGVASSSLVFCSRTGHLRMTFVMQKPDVVQLYMQSSFTKAAFFVLYSLPGRSGIGPAAKGDRKRSAQVIDNQQHKQLSCMDSHAGQCIKLLCIKWLSGTGAMTIERSRIL